MRLNIDFVVDSHTPTDLLWDQYAQAVGHWGGIVSVRGARELCWDSKPGHLYQCYYRLAYIRMLRDHHVAVLESFEADRQPTTCTRS